MNLKKLLYLIFGFIFLILGILGILLPIMPGVIFMVFSAYCFDRSSPKMHEKLLNVPHLGKRIQTWEKEKSMRVDSKLSIISFCVITIGMTHFWAAWNLGIIIICDVILVEAIFWTIAQPTYKKSNVQ